MANAIESTLIDLWCKFLKLDISQASPETTFFEYGGSSLSGIEFSRQLSEKLGLMLPLTCVLQHSTLSSLQNYLSEKLRASESNVESNSALLIGTSPLIGASSSDSALAAMSPLQQAYWYGEYRHYEMGGPGTWSAIYATDFLDVQKFIDSLVKAVDRHPIFRARFDKNAMLSLGEQSAVAITRENISTFTQAEKEKIQRKSVEDTQKQLGSLSDGPHLAIGIYEDHERVSIILVGRLLIMDGMSADVFANDLWAIYNGKGVEPINCTPLDYFQHLAAYRSSSNTSYMNAVTYWDARLQTLPGAPELPKNRATKSHSNDSVIMKRHAFMLPKVKWENLKRNAAAFGITPTVAVCAVFSEILSRWTGQNHFTLNMMHGNRFPFHPDVDKLVGCLSDTLLLEVKFDAGVFSKNALSLQQQLFSDMEHVAVSGTDVLRKLAAQKGYTDGQPLMPVVFASALGSQSDHETAFFMEKFGWQPVESGLQTPHVLLDHQILENNGDLILQWDAREDILPLDFISSMLEAYQNLLGHLSSENSSAWTHQLPDLLPSRQREIRTLVNNTSKDNNSNILLHQALVASALKFPQQQALRTLDYSWSYLELLAWAQASARELTARQLHKNELVGVFLPKSAEQITATLAILLAGGVYVPIAIDTPVTRVKQIVDKCNLRFLYTLDNSDGIGALEFEGVTKIQVPTYDKHFEANFDVRFSQVPSDLGYVIFTSGTTGIPKGVAITHESAMNTIVDINQRFNVTDKDKIIGVSELNFDLSVYDIFGTFSSGATLILPDHKLSKNPIHLCTLIEEFKVSVWNSVPAFFEMLVEYCELRELDALQNLTNIFLSGDWIPISLPDRIKKLAPQSELISMGGATEASIWSNYHIVKDVPADWTSIPYGKPLTNQYFCVLTPQMEDAPDWVPGELYIGGKGLAKEYYADPERTSLQFIRHAGNEQCLYRTGDWARYWPDGTLEFLGRRDTQVKIRGHRIELGDLDAAFGKLSSVKDSVSIVNLQNQQLVSFVVLKIDTTPDSLLAQVSEYLPKYMIPTKVIILESLPLTANKKIDRSALASLAESTVSELPDTISTPLEKLITDIWAELLSVATIRSNQNYFELGGTSISAIRMLSILSQKLKKELPFGLIFDAPTPKELAVAIEALVDNGPSNLVALNNKPNQNTVYCVHPVGGNVFCYRDFAQLWQGKVFGVQSIGLDSEETPLTTIKEMANVYTQAILDKQLAGPILILGWSMGGLIALEMARIISKKGREVKVAILDTWVPTATGNFKSTSNLSLVNAFFSDITEGKHPHILSENGNAADDVLIKRGKEWLLARGIDVSLSDVMLTRLFNIYKSNHMAISSHIPLTTKAPILFIDAIRRDSALLDYLEPLSHSDVWLEALPDVTKREIDANHFQVISAEALQDLLPMVVEFYREHQ